MVDKVQAALEHVLYMIRQEHLPVDDRSMKVLMDGLSVQFRQGDIIVCSLFVEFRCGRGAMLPVVKYRGCNEFLSPRDARRVAYVCRSVVALGERVEAYLNSLSFEVG